MKARKADVRIFVSYAHRDPPLFLQSLQNLLRWPGVAVSLWTDKGILPGSVPDKEIRAALDEMDIFVAMITPFYDASRYIHAVEVPIAKRRFRKNEVLVAPVVVDHPGGTNCSWLLDLECLPDKHKSWAEIRGESLPTAGYDQALRPLRDGVRKLVEEVRKRHATVPPPGP